MTQHRITVNRRPLDYRSGIRPMDNPKGRLLPAMGTAVLAGATMLAAGFVLWAIAPAHAAAPGLSSQATETGTGSALAGFNPTIAENRK